tara:strand:- start:34807 stop:35679 length:873 start_codon:yes stop_codon:yes gene_type:complete
MSIPQLPNGQMYFGDAGTPSYTMGSDFIGGFDFNNSGGFSLPDLMNNDLTGYGGNAPSFPVKPGSINFGSSESGLQNNLNNILGFLNTDEVKGGIRALFSSGDGNPYPGFDNELTEETVQRIGAETELRLNDLRNTLNDIAYLTGKSTPEFVSETDARYAGYLEPASQRGYDYLFDRPAQFQETIAGDSEKVRGSIDDYLESYSNLNRKTFMDQAENPTTVSIDPSVYDKQINKYMDKANMSRMYDYGDPQSQEFIQGAGAPGTKYDRQRMAGFFANDPGVQQLMSYSSY